MSFTVEWMPLAEQRLAEIWNAGPDRQDISDAANGAEYLLRRNPLAEGESRAGDARLMFAHPLSFLFRVDVRNRIVQIVLVKREKPEPDGT
jgi:hypothetical protein